MPVPLRDQLPTEDRFLLDGQAALLLSPAQVDENLIQSGLDAPYLDPRLKAPAKVCGGFVRQLAARRVVTYGRECRSRVGAFFVRKKGGDLRLIFDTRIANCHFPSRPGLI